MQNLPFKDEIQTYLESECIKQKQIIIATPAEAFGITDPFDNQYNEDDEIPF